MIPIPERVLHAELHVPNVSFYVEARPGLGEGGGMEITCTACGASAPAAARFCPACGAIVDDRPLCACGAPLPSDARFCPACGRTTLEPPEPQAERRPVTVLFADAVGSTAFAERAGDEAAYRFVQDCVALMSAAVERHGGTITQFRGDGVMALFGAPIAHEDSAVRAATAALEMRDSLAVLATERGCSFRIGLSTGPVVVGRVGDDVLMDYTAIGDTANVAARMEAAAPPGSVLLSDSTWRAVRQYVECRSAGELDVKGKSAPVSAHEAVRRRPIRTRLEAAVERGLGPFVGRGRELDVLLGHVDALASGRGHIIELTGEAGIGKSRLLLELHRRLPESVGWIEGHCSASGAETPYLPIADMLRNAFAVEENDDREVIQQRVDSAAASWSEDARLTIPYLKYLLDIDPGDDSVRTADARLRRAGILDALRVSVSDAARRQPRVIVIEDVHWADAASIDALDALADVTEATPILLLTTSRPGPASPFDRRSSHSRVALDGISEEATTAMAAGVLDVEIVPEDVAALIASRSDGNPLFVEELTASLVEAGLVVRDDGPLRLARPAETIDVPDTLQDVILARIDRLAREARDALQLAAVIGREFTVRLLDRLAGLPDGLDEALGELKSVELIRQKSWFPELAYLFKHAITHEVTYATLLDERRRALHRLVAQAIEDVYADRLSEHVETLAHHWTVAEDWPRALEYLEQAGDRAMATFASDAAISYYEQAITVAERIDQRVRAGSIFQRLGDVHMSIGDLTGGAAVFGRMAALARAVPDPETLAWALAYQGEAYAYLHDLDRGEACLHEALSVVDAPVAPRAYAALFLKALLFIFGRADETAAVDPMVEDLWTRAPEHPRVVAGWQSLGALIPRWQGDLERCLEILEPSPPDETDLLVAQGIMWLRGIAFGEVGRYDDAIAELQQTIARSTEAGELMFRARSYNTLGWVRLEIGDHAGAIDWNQQCIDFLRAVDIPDEEVESNARLNMAEAHLALGDVAAAAAELARVDEIVRGQPIRGTWMLWRFKQRFLLLSSTLDLATGAKAPDSRIEDAVALAETTASAKYLAKAARLRGRWRLAAGDAEGAEHEAGAALEIASKMGHPSEQWRARVLLADATAARDDAEAARLHRCAADDVLAGIEDGLRDPAGRAGVARLRAALR